MEILIDGQPITLTPAGDESAECEIGRYRIRWHPSAMAWDLYRDDRLINGYKTLEAAVRVARQGA